MKNLFTRRFRFWRSPHLSSLLLTLLVLLGGAAASAFNPAFRLATNEVEHEPAQEFEGDASKKQDWFYFQRTYPFGKIPDNARLNAWNRRPASVQGPQALGWVPLGPAPTNSDIPNWGLTSGRINAIAVSPANPNLILLGGSTGGIWRSTDGGTTFTAVSDNQVDLGVGAIAFAPSNPTIVYAGMGDRGSNYFGTGVLKSTDSGQTWTRVNDASLPTRGLSSAIAVSPTDPNLVFLAQFGAQNGSFRDIGGLYRSTNGGVSWTRTLAGSARDVVLRPNFPGTVYLAMQDTDQMGMPGGVYRSTDGGLTWLNVYASPYNTVSNIKVAVTAANDAMLYVYLGGTTAQGLLETRVEVSTNGGANFTNRGNAGLDTGQFDYNNYLAASPADANTIYVGTRDIFKSTNGGVSYVNLTNNFDAQGGYNPNNSNAHPDQHCLAFVPGNANTIFVGNDGGIYKSTDGGTTITHTNTSLALTQFVGYALHPTDANRSYGGAQDNGSQKRINTNTPGAWREFTSGDGGRTVINPLDPAVVFSTYIYGSITRWLNNAETRDNEVGTNAAFGEPENGARISFYPPFTGNKVNSTLYFGTWRLFISTNLGDTWTAPGGMTDLTTGDPDVLSAIGVSRSNTNVIYTGSVQGRAMVSTNGGVNWTDITAGLPMRSITAITVSPTNPAQAYLTVSGYGSGHIWLTTNSGANWTNLSNNLPDIPTNALLIDPLNAATLYVGTDIGVFRSTDNGTTWNTFNNGLPPVVVTNLDAQANGRIQLATYGRGAYELVTNLPDCAVVTGLAPDTGATGTPVVITGTDLTGVTTVKFSGNVNAVNPVITATQITAIVPTGAVTGPITLSKAGCPDVQTATFTVTGACPTITIAGTLPNGTNGTPYPAQVLTASGGATPYTFTVSAGALPTGLQLQGATANTITVSGTPTASGSFTFTLRATDANQCLGERQFTIFIPGNGRVVKADFDGDGKTDLSVFRPTAVTPTPNWLALSSLNSQALNFSWGGGYAPYFDVPVPGDYDGDGKTDYAIWRGADTFWYLRRSSDSQPVLVFYGANFAPYFDIPTPGDFDGDGKTDIAVFRRSGTWFVRRSTDGGDTIVNHGQAGDVPLAADFDGDGKCDFGVFRPDAVAPNPNWLILQSSTNTVVSLQWGGGYAPYFDVPVPADYDGDGKADLAIWRGADSIWYIRPSATPNNPILDLWGANYAPYNDIPTPGDYDGDGKADIAVFRRTGTWFVKRSSNGSNLIQDQGQQGDLPLPANGVR